ncbi:MAG: DUF4153 domain-containing protein [Alphaproteobacteria bacterium]
MSINTKHFRLTHFSTIIQETFKRFPLSYLSLLSFALLSINQIHNLELIEENLLARIIALTTLSFTWFTAIKFYAESQKYSLKKYLLVALIPFALLSAYTLSFYATPLFLLLFSAAIGFFWMAAPFFRRKTTDTAFWSFNAEIGIASFFISIAIFLLASGISITLLSIDYLFSVDINYRVYLDVWILVPYIIGGIYFLSIIPQKFDAAKAYPLPKALKSMIAYILTPLVVIYFVVLYAYIIKIIVQWDLPKGNLGYMITAFGSIGIAIHLMAFSLKNSSTVLVKNFYNLFYAALIPPVLVLFIGLYTRISAYGVTEQRYALLLSGLWFLGLAIYSLLKKEKFQLKHIPLSLAALLVLSSFGPWGMEGYSTISQVNRLEKMLVKNDVLKENKFSKEHAKLSFADEKEIGSIVDYFYDQHKLNALQKWLPEDSALHAEITKHKKKKQTFLDHYSNYGSNTLRDKVLDKMGLKYIRSWENGDKNPRAVKTKRNIYIGDYDYLSGLHLSDLSKIRYAFTTNIYAIDGRGRKSTFKAPEGTYKISKRNSYTLVITHQGKELLFDLRKVAKIEDDLKTMKHKKEAKKRTLSAQNSKTSVDIYVENMRAECPSQSCKEDMSDLKVTRGDFVILIH